MTKNRRQQMLDSLADDIRHHIDAETQDNVARGMSPDDARTAALRKFGNRTRITEDTRDVWSTVWLEQLLQDVRYALRSLRKSPGFAAVAILTVALGIGATTAIFSVVDATLLHPLPFPHPEQLVRFVDDLPGIGAEDVGMSIPELRDLQNSGIFAYVAPIGGGSCNLTGASQPERIFFTGIGPNYFALLGVQPELGRTFNPNDHTPGFNLEGVISDALWRRAFAADPHVLGKSIRLDNDLYTIVGVMPPGFREPGRTPDQRTTEIWLGNNFDAPPAPNPVRSDHYLRESIGRIQPGLTLAQAQSRTDSLVAALQKQFPDIYLAQNAWRIRLVPLQETLTGGVRPSLLFLLCAVSLVLLICCVNVANLLLARATARGREMAIRQSLGAARMRLVRQLLTESLLLSLLGAAVGLAILVSLRGVLLRLIPDSLPRLTNISINWTVLLFALGVSLVAGAIFGLAPALQTGRIDFSTMLKQEGRGSTASTRQARTRRALVVTEFAFSLVLLIAASLLLRSFWHLLQVSPGFNPENVMAVKVWLPIPNDPATDIYRTAAQEAPFLREVLRRAHALPGVEEAAIADMAALPLGHAIVDQNPYQMALEGRDYQPDQAPIVSGATVTPDYFHLLRMPLLRGRLFTNSDDENAPLVAVVNESFARTYWPNDNPIGRRIKLGRSAANWTTIIGILADARTESLDAQPAPQIFINGFQRRSKDLVILLRGHLDAASIPVQLRAQVQSINPELPVYGAEMLLDTVSDSLAQRRFSLETVALFAITALLLAAIGIYGVISCLVTERRHEIAIRLALGAQRNAVLSMVLRQGLTLAVAGAAAGLVSAVVVVHFMSRLLYGLTYDEPLIFVTAAVLLVVVAALACYIPARRATRTDPITALRGD